MSDGGPEKAPARDTPPEEAPILVADIGGTNARFALVHGEEIVALDRERTADIRDLARTISELVERDARLASVRAVALAGGGPVINGRIDLTNAGLLIDPAVIEARCGFEQVLLMNDFEAVAWSLPALTEGKLHRIGGNGVDPTAPKVAIGPGTGLGVAAWIPVEGRTGRAVATEGGHVTLAARTPAEADVIRTTAHRYGHVSAERLVSGPGLIEMLKSHAPDKLANWQTPAEIVDAATDGIPQAVHVMELFFGFLGTVAADLALSYGAKGGVYLGGGILKRMVDRVEASIFRKRFEDKGRFSTYLAPIPTYLILEPEPAFVGLAYAARTALAAADSSAR